MTEHDLSEVSELTWRKSSFSSDQECVEVADVNWRKGYLAVRDSKHPSAGALVFPASAWQDFLAGAKRGEFDIT